MANIVLKTSTGDSAISTDPDRIGRRLYKAHSKLQTVGGRQIKNIMGIHYDHELIWKYMTAAQFEALRELYYSGELLYLDDGNVPPLVETGTLYTVETDNYVDITAPSGTHKAYRESSETLSNTKDALETTEYTTAQYVTIKQDNGASVDEQLTGAENEFYYHKFSFLSGIDQSGVRSLRIRAAVWCLDYSTENLPGAVLFGWNGTIWVELGRHSVSATGSDIIEYRTTFPQIAQSFIDPDDNYIRLLLRSKNAITLNGFGWERCSSQDAAASRTSGLVNLSGTLYVIRQSGRLYEWDGSDAEDSLTLVSAAVSPGTVGPGATAVYNGKIYMGSESTGTLNEWNGADDWVEVAPQVESEDITALAVYDDGGGEALYASTLSGKLLLWNDVDTLTEVAPQFGGEFVYCLAVYDDGGGDDLYAGTFNEGKLYKWNDTDAWTEIADQYGSETAIYKLVVYDDGDGDRLYGGSKGTGLLLRLNAGGDAWEIKATQYESCEDVRSLAVYNEELYAGLEGDGYNYATLKWDGASAWVEVAPFGHDAPREMLVFSSSLYGEIGSAYAPGSLDRYSAAYKYELIFSVDYIEYEINENLTTIITLTHTPILAEGDVIWVKNLTQETTLEFTTDYTIDGKEITVAGQDSGDEIEVKYNRYHEVKFDNLPEDWLRGDPGSDRRRGARVLTTTQTQNSEDS